jgi:hypothetical protein
MVDQEVRAVIFHHIYLDWIIAVTSADAIALLSRLIEDNSWIGDHVCW